uniref:Putative secreted protein n=1 Tax=Ixodes ricinus TaxID=34613 RepID=A0A147BEW5_IXORI
MSFLCSCWRPYSLSLLASCWAFFLSRQAREASLFFSLRDLWRALKGSSLTGVRSLMTRPSLRSSSPMLYSLRGLGVRSLPSPRRALPACFTPSRWHSGLNTGSVTSWSTCGSAESRAIDSRGPLGPLACTLYCQK